MVTFKCPKNRLFNSVSTARDAETCESFVTSALSGGGGVASREERWRVRLTDIFYIPLSMRCVPPTVLKLFYYLTAQSAILAFSVRNSLKY